VSTNLIPADEFPAVDDWRPMLPSGFHCERCHALVRVYEAQVPFAALFDRDAVTALLKAHRLLACRGGEVPRGEQPVPKTLTANDPEPPAGTRVQDATGAIWQRHAPHWTGGACNWFMDLADGDTGDPESWTKVAGNYGPVTIL
jgi:hypothetical protein